MEAAQHIVKLGPVAVEVVDRTLIELARDIAMFRPVMEAYVRGKPDALLLVEFAEDDQAENLRRLDRLDELMGDLGHPNSVVKVADAAGQKAVWEVRASGLNIMMSMKSEGKPVSFIEDCAVPLEHLADYTERLTAVFEKHGTKGTWYAHASRRLPARAPGAQPEAGEGRQAPCAPSPRRRSRWSRTTRARTRASTATAWCAPSSTRRCTAARRWRFSRR